jgi:hypothetical protein
MPVPVLLTLGDWNPATTGLIDWADKVLARDYGAREVAGKPVYRELLEDGRIALFLDGLDEMPKQFWTVASRRIEEAPHLRIVLTARPPAGERAHVAFAARITLEPVVVEEAADYLRAACNRSIHPDKWDALGGYIESHPDSLAARVLCTPLMLSLALSTFDREGADPLTLVDDERFSSEAHMETFLISQMVPVAFGGPDADEGPSSVTPEVAMRHLRSLAGCMGAGRDLAWWRVRRWLPAFAPAVLCLAFMGVVAGAAGVLAGPGAALALGLPGAAAAPLAGGATAAFATRRGRGRTHGTTPRLFVSVLVGFLFGACMAMVPRLEAANYEPGLGTVGLGVLFGLAGGVAVGVLALHDGPLIASPRRVSPKDVLFGIPAGVATGLTYGLAEDTWIGAGLGALSALGFMVGVAWTRPPDRPEEGATPLSSFRRDIWGGVLLGSVISGTATIAFAIVLGEDHDVVTATLLAAGLTWPFAALIGASTSQACALILTLFGLRLSGVPLPRKLLSVRGESADRSTGTGNRPAGFLEDARARNILRSVGTLYQFRHARLQDELRAMEP